MSYEPPILPISELLDCFRESNIVASERDFSDPDVSRFLQNLSYRLLWMFLWWCGLIRLPPWQYAFVSSMRSSLMFVLFVHNSPQACVLHLQFLAKNYCPVISTVSVVYMLSIVEKDCFLRILTTVWAGLLTHSESTDNLLRYQLPRTSKAANNSWGWLLHAKGELYMQLTEIV